MSQLIPASLNDPKQLFTPLHSDIMERLLADKRSDNTKRAYTKDLKDFFRFATGREPNPENVLAFLRLTRVDARDLVLAYKAALIGRGLAEATVNRRLSAIRSLVNYAYEAGQCDWKLSITSEKVKPYRDTSGISCDAYKKVLAIPDRLVLKGKRDYALLRLLWDNALRRGEISSTNIKDFDPDTRTLKIYGKGRGTQAEIIDLSQLATEALLEWLNSRGESDLNAPLFIALDRANLGHRLTGWAIDWIVKQTCKAAGITKQMSPHRIRHSSITAALDACDGNVRKVQQLSRHTQLETLMIYDDNRQKWQKELTELLADMV